MTKEILGALVQAVQEDFADKLEAQETALIHDINGLIRILTELKRKDIPFSTTHRLWQEFSLKVNDTFECKGKIDAYYYAKQLSSVLKKDSGSEVNSGECVQINIAVGDSVLTRGLKSFTVKKILSNSVITEEGVEIFCGDIVGLEPKEEEHSNE
jgi:hypothetical protein